MSAVALQILVIFFLILVNGAFAMAEIAVVSSRKGRLQALANQGNRRAQQALDLGNHPTHFLSTVQIGITLIGVLSGAFGGATLAAHIQHGIALSVPALAPYSEAIGVTCVVVIVTYLSVIVGELVPKRLALAHPETVAMLLAGPIRIATKMASPCVRFLSFSTDLVLRLLGAGGLKQDPPVTEEEIKTLVEQGTIAGVFAKSEQAMMERVLALSDRKVSSIMTPRPEIVWIDIADSLRDMSQKMRTANHSHFPVVQDSLDNLLGTVRPKDLFCQVKWGENGEGSIDLSEYLYPALYIPETNGALQVLEMFKETGSQIGYVIDEYGAVQGLVTLTDILEAIVGDIPSTNHPEQAQAMQRDDGSWLLDGTLPVEEFRTIFKVASLPGEEKANFQTLAGFILSVLGRIPVPTDHFSWEGMRIEVLDMDGTRIDKVLLSFEDSGADGSGVGAVEGFG